MTEPIRWTKFLLFMHDWMLKSEMLTKLIPLTADIFVFTYPVFLVAVYFYAIWKKNIEHKIWALFIFFSVFFATIFNIFSQLFFDKQRPNVVLWLVDEKVETVLHKFLPSSSFPSDHAVVSFSIATAILMYWIYKKNKFYKITSIIFYIFAVIMCLARITSWVHWPTDIIAWAILWIIIPILLIQKKVFWLLDKYILKNIVKIEENILNKIIKRN